MPFQDGSFDFPQVFIHIQTQSSVACPYFLSTLHPHTQNGYGIQSPNNTNNHLTFPRFFIELLNITSFSHHLSSSAAMTDLFRSFLDIRPLCTNYNLHLFLPPKHLSHAFVHSHYSRINRIKRKPLHLTRLSKPSSPIPSSPDFDIISTHEHSDGSLIFRFGDPTEIAKKFQMEEPKVEKKEIERGGEAEGSTDHEREVILKKIERDVKGSDSAELTDESISIVTRSKAISIVETQNELSEMSLDGSNETELPIVVSTVDIKVSTHDNDIENIENAEEGLNKEHQNSCPAGASALDKNLNRENSIVTVESPAKNIVDVTSLQSIAENVIFQGSQETDTTTEASTDETIEDGAENGSNELLFLYPQLEPALSLSKNAEDQNLQSVMQNVIIESCSGNGSGSDNNDTVAISPQMEAAIYLTLNAEFRTSVDGTGMTNEVVIDGSESDMIQLMPMSSQLEAEPVIDEEQGNGTVEDYMDVDGAESRLMLDGMPQNLIPEPERNVDGDNVEHNGILEASGNEVKEQDSTEAATYSRETLMTNFFLSTGAVILPHPSKVLSGGEDAYFISGEKWLGVADGVGQWSLEEGYCVSRNDHVTVLSRGTNPGVYAQELMKNCEKLISDCTGNSINHPKELLNLSVAETHTPGSSTVLIAQCDGQQALQVVNVGDSGFIILRHGTVYKMSFPMLHAFHFPLRIERGDDPLTQAELYRIDLEGGDVIVIATDGLLDNLYDQEIASIILQSLAAEKKLEEIAKMLATKAQEVGRSASARSPFSDSAQAAGYAGYTGGKLDDVTVVVSTVQKQSNSQTS